MSACVLVRTVRSLPLFIVCAALLAPSSARAWGRTGQTCPELARDPDEACIQSVVADTLFRRITIVGVNLGTVATPPQVKLGTDWLQVLSFTSTAIVAVLNELEEGQHTLVVYVGGDRSNMVTVKVGELAGPQGPPGPKGDTGPAGAKGDTGLAGAKGDTGPAGAKGDTGAQGSRGPGGTNGVSVTSVTLDAGDAHCPAGGVQLTSASGVQFVCNGASGGSLPVPDFVGEGGKRVASATFQLPAGSVQSFTVACGAGQSIVGPVVQVPSHPDPRTNFDAVLLSADFAVDHRSAAVTFQNGLDLSTSGRVDFLCQVPGPLSPVAQSSEQAGWFGMNPSQAGTYVSCPGIGRPLSNVHVIPDPQSPYPPGNPPPVTISYLLQGYEALVMWDPSSGWGGDFGLAFDCWSFPGSGLVKLELTRRTFGVGIPLATTVADTFGCSSPSQLVASEVTFQATAPLTKASAVRSADSTTVSVQLAHGEDHGVSATIEFYCGTPLP